ncbi:MAG: rRNA maturation RNase YbeY [Primorskyibacter sp.]
MSVDTIIEDPRWDHVGLTGLADRAVAATLAHRGLSDAGCELCLMACDDVRIAALNADFRGKPQPTNVLSWPSEDRAADRPGGIPAPPVDLELGDIALAYDTCLSEAQAADVAFADHVTHLIVHGTLHLLGYDHIKDADADVMERIEVEILGNLNISNPY